MTRVASDVDVVTLSAGDLEAGFVPGLGMVGVSLRHRGVELLDLRDGLKAYAETGAVMGIPLLHPWANRLGAFEYEFEGRPVRLPRGAPLVHCDEHGLPIHGLLNASRGWHVEDIAADRLVAVLDFGAHAELLAAFPFRHTITLDVRLDPSGLELATTLRATGSEMVPVSFGLHPYLRLPGTDRASWQISLPVRRRLEIDARAIPTGGAAHQRATTFLLGDLAFDDGYDGLEDGAIFRAATPQRAVEVTLLRGYPAAQVFSPRGAQFICFEPMTAPTNALRTGARLRRVAPGETFTAVFRIDVTRTCCRLIT